MSKAGKPYNMIKVYDPNAPKQGATAAPATAVQADGLPF